MLDMYSILRAAFLSAKLKDSLTIAASDSATLTACRAENVASAGRVLAELADAMGFRLEKKDGSTPSTKGNADE